MKIRYRPLLALLAGFALLSAACSSDEPDIAEAKPASAEQAAPSAPALERQDPVAVHKAMRKLWEDHIEMSDALASGIVTQFPQKFTESGY